MTEPTILKGIIALARANQNNDPGLAAFIVRDLPETEAAQLSDLAWAMHLDANVHRNDVKFLLDELEAYLERTEESEGEPDHLPNDT